MFLIVASEWKFGLCEKVIIPIKNNYKTNYLAEGGGVDAWVGWCWGADLPELITVEF